ncbi:hypothetical protein Tco_1142118 [Tanacetum coccineum]
MLQTGMGAGLKGNPKVEVLRNKGHNTTRTVGGHQPSNNSRGNLPPKGMHLSYNAPFFIPNSMQPSSAPVSNHDPILNGSTYPSNTLPNSYPFYTQHINLLSNAPIYPSYGPTGLFTDFTGCVTPFVHGIEDYPLPDGLKMPSHVGSYDEKGDPNNYLHLFEGGIPKEVATNEAPNDHREGFDRFNKGSPWYNKGKKKNRDRFSPYRGSNHGLLSNLSKSPREILATEKTPDQRSRENKATHPSRERNKEGKSKGKAIPQKESQWKNLLAELGKSHSPCFRHQQFLRSSHHKGPNIQKTSKPDQLEWTRKSHSLASRDNTLGLSEKSLWKSQ